MDMPHLICLAKRPLQHDLRLSAHGVAHKYST